MYDLSIFYKAINLNMDFYEIFLMRDCTKSIVKILSIHFKGLGTIEVRRAVSNKPIGV